MIRKRECVNDLQSQCQECVDAKDQSITVLADVGGDLEARHRDHHLDGKLSHIALIIPGKAI